MIATEDVYVSSQSPDKNYNDPPDGWALNLECIHHIVPPKPEIWQEVYLKFDKQSFRLKFKEFYGEMITFFSRTGTEDNTRKPRLENNILKFFVYSTGHEKGYCPEKCGISIYKIAPDSWSEDTLTYRNRPLGEYLTTVYFDTAEFCELPHGDYEIPVPTKVISFEEVCLGATITGGITGTILGQLL